jgi:hypothetical protein
MKEMVQMTGFPEPQMTQMERFSSAADGTDGGILQGRR